MDGKKYYYEDHNSYYEVSEIFSENEKCDDVTTLSYSYSLPYGEKAVREEVIKEFKATFGSGKSFGVI